MTISFQSVSIFLNSVNMMYVNGMLAESIVLIQKLAVQRIGLADQGHRYSCVTVEDSIVVEVVTL